MILLPYDKIEIESQKTPEQVMEMIKDKTQVQEHLSFTGIRFMQSESKTFAGEIKEDSFRISRIIIGRNSFLPVIQGTVEKATAGAKALITMSLSKITAVIMAIIFLAALFVAISPLFVDGFSPKNIDQLFVWLGIILVIYAFMTVSFRFEAKKAKKILKEMFED